jgi:hypothetical protein
MVVCTPPAIEYSMTNQSEIDGLRAGDIVTIVNRFGQRLKGRVVMRGTHGWVLNLGGQHGTPGSATKENIVQIKAQIA